MTQPTTPMPKPSVQSSASPEGGPEADWAEGQDGTDPTYTERLVPGPVVWVSAACGVLALAVAYAKALGTVAGLVLGIGGMLLAAAVILGTAAQVVVDSRVLRAGRARLPLEYVGQVIIADQAALALARGPGGDPSAHMVTTVGVHAGIVVEVTDTTDPHRTWLIASRRPGDLARALRGARGKVAS